MRTIKRFHSYPVEIEYIRPKMNRGGQVACNIFIKRFMKKHDIDVKKIIIDFRKTVNDYKTEGLFGGFKDLYNGRTKTMYYNPHNFVEFIDPKSPRNIAHLAIHELVHTKQIQSKQMIILNNNKLQWKGRVFDRAPFNVDLFNRIREEQPKLAEEYHWRALPWEKDAYQLAEEYMGQPLWRAYS